MTTQTGKGQHTPVPGIVVVDPEAFQTWLSSKDHLLNCIGYSEGQECCMARLLPTEFSTDATARTGYERGPDGYARKVQR